METPKMALYRGSRKLHEILCQDKHYGDSDPPELICRRVPASDFHRMDVGRIALGPSIWYNGAVYKRDDEGFTYFVSVSGHQNLARALRGEAFRRNEGEGHED